MTTIYAGTAFNQVLAFNTAKPPKDRKVYGAMSRDPVVSVSSYINNGVIYATSKAIHVVKKNGSNCQILRL